MAADDDPDSLKVYWDHFFRSETGTYEKTTWLDLFLAEFLIRVREGADPKELIKFCPISGVVSLVGCELLCGLHRVTSSLSLLALPVPPLQPGLDQPPPTPELYFGSADGSSQTTSMFSRDNRQSASEVLRRYLLGGVAWRCLALLTALGVEGLSCCRQLSSVLVWVFGELTAVEPAIGPSLELGSTLVIPPTTTDRTPIHQLFSHRVWAKHKTKSTSTPLSKGHSANSSDRGYVTSRSRHSGLAKTDHTDKSMRRLSLDQSSGSSDSNDDLQVLNRSVTIKVSSPQDDFDYFNSPLRSSNDYNEAFYSDPYFSPRKSKPKADDHMNEKHRIIINTEISSFEFILMITDLLQQLCKAESSLSGSEGSQISVQCINFTLRNLCSLQFGSIPGQTKNYTFEVSRIKLALTELLMVSLDRVLIHSDLCSKLINSGILPMLLRLLEDVTCKSSFKQSQSDSQKRAKETENLNKSEGENLLKFVFGITYCITAFFYCLLVQCRSVDKLREFTDQFKLYEDCLKGGLLRDSVLLMIQIPGVNSDEAVVLIKNVIESIGKLISVMKRVRSEVIHSAACSKSRHKVCRQRVVAGMHHHHDILGEASSGMPISSSCCVSVLYGTLTSLVADEEIAAQSILRNKILKVLLNCGVCCCFAPGVLMESIVRLMLKHHNVAGSCLQLLEHTVYGELGASVLLPKVTDQLPCSICEPTDMDVRETVKKYCPHGINPIERKNTWSFLIHYNSLLQLDNHSSVLLATVNHLLRVTPKCRNEMKYELLFSVIYPTFIVAKHRYMIRLEESAYFLTVSCLNIFANLLNTVKFAEQFIQKGGLSYVLELVSLTEFANQCCSILEIAITVEIVKLTEGSSEFSCFREMSSLTSVQILLKSLSEVTDKFYHICKLKLQEDEFEELCDVTQDLELINLTQKTDTDSPKRKVSSPLEIATKNLANDTRVVEECVEDYLEVLKNVCTFWKSCAGLCVRGAAFRWLVAGEGGALSGEKYGGEGVMGPALVLRSLAALRLALRLLVPAAPAERRLLVSLIEALLQLHFALSDVTAGGSKQASCRCVRSALSRKSVPVVGGPLRALCDALVRAAGANVQRALLIHKMAPLGCPSSNESADGSSSEASLSGPYASERSDAPSARVDDGYDADVEIGHLDSVTENSKNLSSSLLQSDGSFAGVCSALGDESMVSEQRGGELAHPELCVIVVDILAQIANKVMDAVEGAEAISEEVWSEAASGASVARACAARLQRAGAATPALLPRLLAPRPARLFTRVQPRLAELQRSILELVHVLASQHLEPSELASFFKLFLADEPPLSMLLGALQRLIDSEEPNTPDFVLTFPAEKYQNDQLVPEGAARSLSDRLSESHTRAGITSAWSRAAMTASVEGGWAPWVAGFGLSAWLWRLPRDRRDNVENWPDSVESEPIQPQDSGGSLLHIFSMGNDSLVFEMWLHTGTGTIVFRASRPETTSAGLVSSAAVGGALPAATWSLLAINVAERLQHRRIHLQVTLYVNGHAHETVSLPIQGILVRKVSALHVALGAGVSVGGAGGGAAALGGLRLYRGAGLTRYHALHLAAHTPDSACELECISPNYPSILTPEIINSDIDWEQVFEMPNEVMRDLHDSCVLSYSAHAPATLVVHHQPTPAVFGVRGGMSGVGGARGVAVRAQAAVRVLRRRTLLNALCTLGGLDHLLYLFARVVEMQAPAAEQAAALRVLMRVCHLDGRLYAQLYAEGARDRLRAVLPAASCGTSHHLLQVIMEEACSESVLVSVGGTSRVRRAGGALRRPALLALVMAAWTHFDTQQDLEWEVESEEGRVSGSVWALFLECCCSALVPYSRFNAYQADSAGLLEHLLLACKERYLCGEDGADAECPAATSGVVRLARGLVHSATHLATLADFLLLMHQASDTFVTHSRANFYFLLTPEPQEMSAYSTSSMKKKSTKKRKKTPKEQKNTDEGVSDNSSLHQKDHSLSSDVDEKVDPDGSVDSSKELKGLINAKIKESTSKNSDTTALETTDISVDRRADADLSEYVVVDPPAATRPDINLYSAKYHQGVKAGASPGWSACEGLLLLLRDTLVSLSDDELAQVVSGPVSVPVLVVLANRRSGPARATLVRALAAIQTRPAPPTATPRHTYLHLAHQISLYDVTWDLASACASLITNRDLPLEDQLHESIWAEASEEWASRAPPLLALLPAGAAHPRLAAHLARLLRALLLHSSLRALNEVAFTEVVVKTIYKVSQLDELQEEHQQLLQELYQLLVDLALQAITAPHGMQTICDIHNMLLFYELAAEESSSNSESEDAEEGASDQDVETEDSPSYIDLRTTDPTYYDEHASLSDVRVTSKDVRATCACAQANLFIAQLDALEQRLAHATSQSVGNYFSTVLSSVSLGGESRMDRGEWAARHAATAARATHYLVGRTRPLAGHAHLYRRLLHTLLLGVGESAGRGRWWAGSGSGRAGLLRDAVWWGVGVPTLHSLLLRALYRAPPTALQPLAPHEPHAARKLAVCLLWMVHLQHLVGESAWSVELPIVDWARGWAVSAQAALPYRLSAHPPGARAAAEREPDLRRWARAQRDARPAIARSVFSKESWCGQLAESAMAITRQVVEAQNARRKAFMQHLRRETAARGQALAAWRTMVDDHTHDQGVWHEPRSYPRSWQLDPAERCGRVRVRLRRAHLRIPPKFLKHEHQYKAEVSQRGPPLWGVVRGGGGGGGARLAAGEAVGHMARATHLAVHRETPGDLLLTDRSIHFVPDEGEPREWRLSRVCHVAARRWCLQERAAEVFLSSGRAHLLAFAHRGERDAFLQALAAAHLPCREEPDTLNEAMNQWRNGTITNWEYLMRLNSLAGRSYNDLMQYPVLPFVLADYTSRVLDLRSERAFRKLHRPVAVQNVAREQHYRDTYEDLKSARKEGCSPLIARQPHHYASLYSNSGGVLHYLVRLPPFTELFLNYQDNNFDMPDRTFHSLATTWRLITNDSPTDVKELIPELFYLPELFYNNEGLELGVRQCGLGVDSVEVPPWAAEARLFTLLHRQALEAPHVSDNLPHWLDLVFGYKQTGQAAIDALNVFPACTYYGFDPQSLEDEVDRTAAAAMVRTYGQAPRQLLRAPHPHRARDLLAITPAPQIEACSGALGVRWGRYCGSPECGPPRVVARVGGVARGGAGLGAGPTGMGPAGGVAHVVPLPQPRVAALLPPRHALIMLPGESTSWGVVWWGAGGGVRLRTRKDTPHQLLLHLTPAEQITCVFSSSNEWQPLLVGFESGRVEAWRLTNEGGATSGAGGGATNGAWRVTRRVLCVLGSRVAHVTSCASASLLAAAAGPSLLLWDMHKLSYIRTIPNRGKLPITCVAISPTLSDVASVHDVSRPISHLNEDLDATVDGGQQDLDDQVDSYERDASEKYQSIIRVHTVNARFVGSVRVSEVVTCACYSRAVEGASVNVVAAGLRGGGLRLYSAWDLRPAARLPPGPAPAVGLSYSIDSSILYAWYADGSASAWEAEPNKPTPRLLPAHSLL